MTKFFSTRTRFLGLEWGWGDATLYWSAFALAFVYTLHVKAMPPIG